MSRKKFKIPMKGDGEAAPDSNISWKCSACSNELHLNNFLILGDGQNIHDSEVCYLAAQKVMVVK